MARARRATVVEGPDGQLLKVCTDCQESKPLEEFVKNAQGTLGRNSLCKACESARRRQQYQANLEQRRELGRANARRAYARNPKAQREASRRWRQANPEKHRASARNANLKRLYGITQAEYLALLAAQGGVCAVCGTDKPNGRGSIFHVDHDHSTGRMRKLLCHACNTALGSLADDPERIKALLAYRLSFEVDKRQAG